MVNELRKLTTNQLRMASQALVLKVSSFPSALFQLQPRV